ncbi:magnesium transporter CorA family protein [Caenimonas aquaedulcis]|uniref:Magnesium transporter CorA family protein n=1 Tax=Caenimonas aquaedulcis TaxID=2793270 RepID=A0A931H5E6_9BURK|nr:magnesium transporter CorA family protein [Caenimonas aquaedulcis]MBG9388740.1 magnesium transporter CorA family protein [Caenimonas aquaedulcis]
MHIVEFASGTLRFLEQVPASAPSNGFVWIYVERESLEGEIAGLQRAAQTLGGSPLLDLHVKDLLNGAHPSQYDYTSIYDLVIFRRLATEAEVLAENKPATIPADGPLAPFARVRTQAVGFAVFDRLLITVHPAGCFAAKTFIERFLSDAVQAEGLSAAARSRLPTGTSDLMLRMLNLMVDSYLDIRKELSGGLDAWQQHLLAPRSRASDWRALLSARSALHTLEDLCEGQNDAMQEWLDTQREQPAPSMPQAERDGLLARARDVMEHIQRVLHHVRRMEQGAETAVQLHFSALGHRTNEIMRVLTALTAVFLPLNFITGFFGMNFEYLPLIHSAEAMWIMLGVMAFVALVVLLVFWRKRYISRVGR